MDKGAQPGHATGPSHDAGLLCRIYQKIVPAANVEKVTMLETLQSPGDDMPSPDAYDPTAHASHVVEFTAPDAVEYCPAPHSAHPPDEDSPDSDEYVPETHEMQAVDPIALL
jgi:hypothetical protein